MRLTAALTALLVVAAPLGASQAAPANICQAKTLSCPTKMPVGGFCECTAKGQSEDGTVIAKPAPGKKVNSTAGGCGSNPGAPGCN